VIVFRIAQEGEEVVCPKRVAGTARRNEERSQARQERREPDASQVTLTAFCGYRAARRMAPMLAE
jgi:hypothetical protein